ncbi:hypothetical protein B0T21DRAFT_381562 [Apiosordaria backusii]|uniref:Uncharacterized protein n=1 Tax=Apiosordaria backusii TaxID=314023 RepID=A0AA40K0V7_9PEZI|nr:hypothetical protein B0T21DRAFT_381562 [Apiosordaria backusii]
MKVEPNRDEGDEATQQATAGLINEFEQMLGDIGNGSPAEAASTDRQEGERTQINPQTRRPGMFSLFPTRSERTKAANMTASPTTSPSQGNKLSSSSPGSQPTETLAPPGLTSLEERSLSAASVASAPSSGSVSAGEDSLPRPGHNWSNPNRRAARSAINPGASTTILGGTFSSVVVGSRPRPSVSSGVFAAPPVPVSLSPVVPDPASPPAPTRPPPPVPPSRSAPAAPLPPPIPARNPARLGQASPAPPISPKSEMRKKE